MYVGRAAAFLPTAWAPGITVGAAMAWLGAAEAGEETLTAGDSEAGLAADAGAGLTDAAEPPQAASRRPAPVAAAALPATRMNVRRSTEGLRDITHSS